MIAPSRSDVVLVVDDSPDTVRLLTDVLDSAGMTVMVALDGASALRVASRLRPDIVLMDAVMPGMDGFETCRQLKTLSAFDNVPVIFMTGLSEPGDSVRGFEAGGADYVTKPIDLDAMLARIGVHLSNARKIQSARMALDAADQFLVAVNIEGEILWFTPQAYRLLETSFPANEEKHLQLPAAVSRWLIANQDAASPMAHEPVIEAVGATRLTLSLVGRSERGEILLRIAKSATGQANGLRDQFNLTQREEEVARWLAKGKSNRDIAAILSLSPRTIDKHIEVILDKLNVENRTAAAALILSR